MSLYLLRIKQTPETFSRLIENPTDRREAARALIEAGGGSLQGYWYAFGEHDVVVLVEFPDNVAAAAVISKVASSGAWSGGETTVLITVEEMLEAFKRAGELAYESPAG